MPLPKQRSKNPSTTSQRLKNTSALETTLTHPSKCTLETTFTRTTSLKTKKQMRTGQNLGPSDVNMLLINNDTDPMPLPVLHNRRACMTHPRKCTLEINFPLSRQKNQEANAHWMQRNKRPPIPSEKFKKQMHGGNKFEHPPRYVTDTMPLPEQRNKKSSTTSQRLKTQALWKQL